VVMFVALVWLLTHRVASDRTAARSPQRNS
jgi:hypothetical protein